ncbi:MAG: 6-phosphogluconolactonase [Myxococcaceae bacterium]|nr:6-phosphogluconolactonase [Myxococcaceae bacterium]
MEYLVASEGHLAIEARLRLTRAAAEALELRGAFHIAVPGGSVATLLFPSFAEAALDWSRVHVWWVDERVVPQSHPDSNFKAANDLWLSKVPAIAHPFHSVAEYAAQLPLRLDVALLGVGPDGHVASLFPGHEGLDVTNKRAFAVDDSPKPPPRRLTLSLPEICASNEVWVMVAGQAKAAMMAQALRPDSQLPVGRVLREAEGIARLWLDPAAAAQL